MASREIIHMHLLNDEGLSFSKDDPYRVTSLHSYFFSSSNFVHTNFGKGLANSNEI